ncbi:MAG TPA: hypothetical protein VF065_02075 [Ilumatobacter sp.]
MTALVASIATLGFGVLAGCGSSSPGEVIVEPGITAIRESGSLACSSDLANLQLAIEAYSTLNAAPPTAESDLVPDWLRAESELYDLADGQIAPAPGSDCPVPATDAGAAGASPESTAYQITVECDQQRTLLEIAMEAYAAANGSPPPSESDLVPDWLRSEISGYDIVEGAIVPAPGSICPPA